MAIHTLEILNVEHGIHRVLYRRVELVSRHFFSFLQNPPEGWKKGEKDTLHGLYWASQQKPAIVLQRSGYYTVQKLTNTNIGARGDLFLILTITAENGHIQNHFILSIGSPPMHCISFVEDPLVTWIDISGILGKMLAEV